MANNVRQLVVYIVYFTTSVISEKCYSCNFEQDLDILDKLEVCGDAFTWTLQKYSAVQIKSPHLNSHSFISPKNSVVNCIGSFVFPMSKLGVLEVNLYMEPKDQQVGLTVLVLSKSGELAGTASLNSEVPVFQNGWNILRANVSSVEEFDGHTYIIGSANEDAILLIDSLQYLPLGYDKEECTIYRSPEAIEVLPIVSDITKRKPSDLKTTEPTQSESKNKAKISVIKRSITETSKSIVAQNDMTKIQSNVQELIQTTSKTEENGPLSMILEETNEPFSEPEIINIETDVNKTECEEKTFKYWKITIILIGILLLIVIVCIVGYCCKKLGEVEKKAHSDSQHTTTIYTVPQVPTRDRNEFDRNESSRSESNRNESSRSESNRNDYSRSEFNRNEYSRNELNRRENCPKCNGTNNRTWEYHTRQPQAYSRAT